MKELPKLYTNTFNKKIDNSQEYTTVTEKSLEESKPNKYEINKKIDNIFKSNNYIYKIKTKLFLKQLLVVMELLLIEVLLKLKKMLLIVIAM